MVCLVILSNKSLISYKCGSQRNTTANRSAWIGDIDPSPRR